jgi:hypothetical protein
MVGTIAERFWAKVNKQGPIHNSKLGCCWVWTAAKAGTLGYARLVVNKKFHRTLAYTKSLA